MPEFAVIKWSIQGFWLNMNNTSDKTICCSIRLSCQFRQCNFLGSYYGRGTGFAGAVWDKNYISPTLNTIQGGGREPHIIVKA